MNFDRVDCCAEALLTAIREEASAAVPGAGAPPDAVVGNIALQALTQRLNDGVLLESLLRAIASHSIAHGMRKRDVRDALVLAFNSVWRNYSEDLERSNKMEGVN